MFTNTMWVMAAEVQAYQVVILGFGTVFVGLLCLIAIIGLMGKIMAGRTAKEEAAAAAKAAVAPVPETAAPVEEAAEEPEDRQSLIAAMAAAIATVMGKDVTGIRIHSVRKVD